MKKKFSFSLLLICVAVAFISGFSSSNSPYDRDPNAIKQQGTYLVKGPALDNPLSALSESFEGTTFPPAGWIKLNPDGGPGWNRQLAGTAPLPGWTVSSITTPPGGGNAVAYATWNTGGATSSDQWLVTPQITNVQSNDSLNFWLRYVPSSYRDSIEVRISTTTPTVAAMTTIVWRKNFPLNSPDTNWTQYKFNIGSLVPTGSNIYIGWREVVADNLADGASFSLDLVNVTVGSTPATCTFNWQSQTSGTTQSLLSVSAVSNVIGWAGGNGPTVIRTTNGTAWTSATGTGIVGNIFNIWGIDANTALCTTSPGATFIYRTSNGGSTWTQVFTQAAPSFIDGIKMVDANTGYAMGDPVGGFWVLLKTTNGGVNWTQMTTAPAAPAGEAGWNNSFDIEGNSMWWLSNTATGKVYRSTNAGVNFSTSNVGFTTAAYGSIKFAANGLNGIVTSTTGAAARSTDGGATWTTVTTIPGTGGSTAVETGLNGTNVDLFAARGTGIQRSTNGGTNWTSAFTASGTLNDMYFTTSAGCPVGWAVGVGGAIAKMSLLTGISNYNGEVPNSYNLSQNFPNPFNPSTNINFSIPKSGFVTLKIYDMVGKEITTLVNEVKNAGNYIVGFNASNLPSGSYFYRLESDNFIETKKMLLIK